MFEGIVDTRTCKLESKYSRSAFEAAMAAAGVSDPTRCILLDDSINNIKMAKEVGFVTILVRPLPPHTRLTRAPALLT
jgi:putative hydrolase of the HAD superfamily/pyrimidine and pyridine-specific 5'-nucleotidase